jgi:hypothetical protein
MSCSIHEGKERLRAALSVVSGEWQSLERRTEGIKRPLAVSLPFTMEKVLIAKDYPLIHLFLRSWSAEETSALLRLKKPPGSDTVPQITSQLSNLALLLGQVPSIIYLHLTSLQPPSH